MASLLPRYSSPRGRAIRQQRCHFFPCFLSCSLNFSFFILFCFLFVFPYQEHLTFKLQISIKRLSSSSAASAPPAKRPTVDTKSSEPPNGAYTATIQPFFSLSADLPIYLFFLLVLVCSCCRPQEDASPLSGSRCPRRALTRPLQASRQALVRLRHPYQQASRPLPSLQHKQKLQTDRAALRKICLKRSKRLQA